MDGRAQSIASMVARIGSDPNDPDELRQRKSLLVAMVLGIIPPAIVWSGVYLGFREPLAAAIPFGAALIFVAALGLFTVTRRYGFFRNVVLGVILVAPFLLMLALRGYVASSGVIVWSFICPLAAIAFGTAREALRWFVAFACLAALGAVLVPSVGLDNHLPAWLVLALFALNISVVAGIVFGVVVAYAAQRRALIDRIMLERGRADTLLLNVLPRAIAEILKVDDRRIADHFESASVLFADVVDFTPLSATLEPAEVVDLLNDLFSSFDELVARHGLEKIKTIGDCYMVAAGVPVARPDHAAALARLALDLQSVVAQRKPAAGPPVELRIGINSGPVTAGVIGRTRFLYDLWGDTVNTASRMESHGTPRRIQISRRTRELLGDDFLVESRGTIEVKGKGAMETWYLVGLASG